MNINRHNYETFFLLYVDNELSATERKAVEQFVTENPDLKTELQLLLETTLPENVISFDLKNNLYKAEIDREVLQENLLLHLDNELDAVTAGKTASVISSDDLAKQEWDILQRTKLDPNEKIIFANKELLYRHEGSRVVAMRFWRVAAAAAILFAFLYTGVSLLKKDKPVDDKTAINKGKISKPTHGNSKPGSADNSNVPTNSNSPVNSQENDPANIASVKDKEQNNNTSTSASTQDIKNNIVPVKKDGNNKEAVNNDQLAKEEKNKLQRSSLEKINKGESNELIASSVLNKMDETVVKDKIATDVVIASVKDKITMPNVPVTDYNSVPLATNSNARTTTLIETDNSNDDRISYMKQEKVSRTKIGGLFRKVKRVIERNTNIKTGNGVTVAGFEIAVK